MILMLVILLVFSCSDAEDSFSGITVTKVGDGGDDTYTIISIDSDDWEIEYSPKRDSIYPDMTRIGPAYPNPTTDILYFPVDWDVHDRLFIYIKDISGKTVAEIYDDSLQPGRYTSWISWNVLDNDGKTLPSGIYRCFYEWDRVERDTLRFATGYGDIQID